MYKAADVCVADERLCSELGQITRACGAVAGAGSALLISTQRGSQWESSTSCEELATAAGAKQDGDTSTGKSKHLFNTSASLLWWVPIASLFAEMRQEEGH